MQLSEITYQDAVPIDGYGPGFFRIGGQIIEGSILVMPDSVTGWGGFDDTKGIATAADAIDVLLVGTGVDVMHLPDPFQEALDAFDIGYEVMPTPSACRTYNVLLAEGRRVGLALFPV